MVWCRANKPQWNKRTLKKITIKIKKLRISKVTELIVQGVKAKLRISAKKDI